MRSILFSFVAAVVVVWAANLPEAPSAHAQQQDQAQTPGIVAHEWGVWRLEAGRVAHIAELAAEVPPFVIRAPAAGGPAQVIQHPPVARKPVLFLYTDAPIGVRVDVGFRGGEPWLYYPSANRRGDGLTWSGTLRPRQPAHRREQRDARRRLRAAGPPAVARGHFWNDLRAVGASTFFGHGTAEHFLFYDGPVEFERPFQLAQHAGGVAVTPTSTERTLWLVGDGFFNEQHVERVGAGARTVAEGPVAALRPRLEAALRARGLSRAEAGSLLATWGDELFAAAPRRAVYFVPREAYDRMLPLRITPTPQELVRVGLVIERL